MRGRWIAQNSQNRQNSPVEYSKDPDARWLKKGKRVYFGYKSFARTDQEDYIEKCICRPANEAEAPHFETMSEGSKAKRILSDKGNASKANRQALKKKGFKDGVLRWHHA